MVQDATITTIIEEDETAATDNEEAEDPFKEDNLMAEYRTWTALRSKDASFTGEDRKIKTFSSFN